MRRVLRAWKEAEQVLRDHGVNSPPVDVVSIARKYARVLLQPLDPEISGALVPLDDNSWVILVNSDHPPVRQRFTIAHELGHCLLHQYDTPHADRAFKFRDARSSEGSAIEEIQANQFAAELLMPRELILHAIGQHTFEHAPLSEDDPNFDRLVAQLAKDFEVSKQAMTIRLSSLFA